MHIMAAGSLRGALTAILTRYSGNKIPPVTCDFGPAGLLRQKIESGVKCDLFLSADRTHPEALLRNKTAFSVEPFIANYLGITTTIELAEQYPDWQQLLRAPDLIIGTSTPVDDPCGDYVVQFYSELSKADPELAENIRNRTRHLVGGKNSPVIPAGQMASQWLIHSHQADIFIGYRHYQKKMSELPGLATIAIPEAHNVKAIYCIALMSPIAQTFVDYLLQTESQQIFMENGFVSLS
ncbi:substrate-binding domain-containing protein [Morganella morganii]|uniref:substrate-binding domain-containing protein n=1 Tax=Morganella morganii TaxID=582 RepID=UPI001BD41F2D|nr:substrate-binding domain-containing protein [Morganella morganii]MBS9584472.1 substrate-binding domain-containing protein [Morganella morganii subsp. morganii]QWL87214.1 substrate-binding domain-containing protein [Morganella morganii subsp. morganii]